MSSRMPQDAPHDIKPHDLIPFDPEGLPEGEMCMIEEGCDDERHFRKVISHFFGRNKTCTRTIPEHVWCHFCRKHYQRNHYQNKHFGRLSIELVIRQVIYVSNWSRSLVAENQPGRLINWLFAPRKRERLRQDAEKQALVQAQAVSQQAENAAQQDEAGSHEELADFQGVLADFHQEDFGLQLALFQQAEFAAQQAEAPSQQEAAGSHHELANLQALADFQQADFNLQPAQVDLQQEEVGLQPAQADAQPAQAGLQETQISTESSDAVGGQQVATRGGKKQKQAEPNPIPEWMQVHLHKLHTTDDLLVILRELQRRMEAGEYKQVPDIELLPQFEKAEESPSGKRKREKFEKPAAKRQKKTHTPPERQPAQPYMFGAAGPSRVPSHLPHSNGFSTVPAQAGNWQHPPQYPVPNPQIGPGYGYQNGAAPAPGFPASVYPANPNPALAYPGNLDPALAYPGNPNPALAYPGNLDPALAYSGNLDPALAYPGNLDPALTYQANPYLAPSNPGNPYLEAPSNLGNPYLEAQFNPGNPYLEAPSNPANAYLPPSYNSYPDLSTGSQWPNQLVGDRPGMPYGYRSGASSAPVFRPASSYLAPSYQVQQGRALSYPTWSHQALPPGSREAAMAVWGL
ncbi:hypothetical protein DL546_006558 [Coniochaeta pulveracea]|uniref:Uncharacterized protein n=1 Tax=Coniochaeta pulveracea TaxID=177199 RepID=A0A420YCS2_9PEZI|nr:hypothetical protein DL546_006558 [Coniochaeta pulveracea]